MSARDQVTDLKERADDSKQDAHYVICWTSLHDEVKLEFKRLRGGNCQGAAKLPKVPQLAVAWFLCPA
jgi:hypothetical protein